MDGKAVGRGWLAGLARQRACYDCRGTLLPASWPCARARDGVVTSHGRPKSTIEGKFWGIFFAGAADCGRRVPTGWFLALGQGDQARRFRHDSILTRNYAV